MTVTATALLGVVSVAGAPPLSALAVSCRAQVAPTDGPEVRDFMTSLRLDRAEAMRRLGWQMQAQVIDGAMRARPTDGFAGTWLDPKTGRVKLGVRAQAAGAAGAAARRAIAACDLAAAADVVAVRNDAATLDAANSWLGSEIAKVNAGSGPMLGAAVSYSDSAVVLDVPRGALSAAKRALVARARAKYPSVVRVRTLDATGALATCSGFDLGAPPLLIGCTAPLRGGVTIFNTAGKGAICSAGFNAVSRSDGKPYLLTAGHCPAGTWKAVFADGSIHVIGATRKRVFAATGDAGIITVNNPAGWQPRPWALVLPSATTTYNEQYPIRKVEFSVQHMRICKTGTWGTDCGVVTMLGATRTPKGGPTMYKLGIASFCVRKGDSGGSVYATNAAYGLVSGGAYALDPAKFPTLCSSEAWYQGMTHAQDLMNVGVLTR